MTVGSAHNGNSVSVGSAREGKVVTVGSGDIIIRIYNSYA